LSWFSDRRPRSPKPDECLLHHILGIGPARHELPREQHQRSSMLVEPELPVIVARGHAKLTSANNATHCNHDATRGDFCLKISESK
jgi:hypothetical protein